MSHEKKDSSFRMETHTLSLPEKIINEDEIFGVMNINLDRIRAAIGNIAESYIHWSDNHEKQISEELLLKVRENVMHFYVVTEEINDFLSGELRYEFNFEEEKPNTLH